MLWDCATLLNVWIRPWVDSTPVRSTLFYSTFSNFSKSSRFPRLIWSPLPFIMDLRVYYQVLNGGGGQIKREGLKDFAKLLNGGSK